MADIIPSQYNLIMMFITAIVMIPLNGLMLWLSALLFKKSVNYGKAVLVALIAYTPGMIIGLLTNIFLLNTIQQSPNLSTLGIVFGISMVSWIITVLLYLFLPRFILGIKGGKGVLIGLVWYGFNLVVSFIIGLIISVITLIMLGTGNAGLY